MRISRTVVSVMLGLGVVLLATQQAITEKRPGQTQRDRLIESARKPALRSDYHLSFQPDESYWVSASVSPIQAQAASSPPPASPGMPVGITWLDMQSTHSLGKQIARNPGDNHTQMVWNSIQNFDPSGNWAVTAVMYNTYRFSTGLLAPGFGGGEISIGPPALGINGNIDVDDEGKARASYSQREDVNWPRNTCVSLLAAPGQAMTQEDVLYPADPCDEGRWPRIAVQHRDGAPDLVHAISQNGPTCGDIRLWYWRSENYIWSAPVLIDSVFSPSYVIAADNNSDKVAIFLHDKDDPQFNGANNICYYESTTSGLGWISGTELGPSSKRTLTNYTDTVSGPQAWKNIDAVYDNSGRLHVVWDEQQVANKTTNATIRHWNDERNIIRPVMLAVYPNPHLTLRLNVSGLSIGIGDGMTTCAGESNLDMVYVTYTKFGGTSPAEQADVAGPVGGETHPNGELYLSSSNNGGNTWGPPQNLSNTKTPNCNPAVPDSVCRSEDWATIAKHVSNIEIVYISDRDAGAAPQSIGSYQPNDVMYLRIPGGGVNTQYVCPVVAPGFATIMTSDAECEYHAEPGAIKSDELLYILNLGNAPLSGTIEVLPGSPWLTIAGAGAFTIPAGGADLVYTPVMDATGLSEGLYTATIRITHNDSSDPNPYDIPIVFIVLSEFHCPQGAVITTGVE